MAGEDTACKEFTCLASATQIGIIISAVLVTIVGTFAYWHAFIRPRLNKATENSEDHELEVVIVRHHRSRQRVSSVSSTPEDSIRRSRPSSLPRPRQPQTTRPLNAPHGIAYFVCPGPPNVVPGGQIVGILLPAPPNLPRSSAGGLSIPDPPANPTQPHSEPDQSQDQQLIRLPSTGYATTISDDLPDRTVAPDSLAADASHQSSTSLDRESRSRLQDLMDSHIGRSPVTVDDFYTPEVPHPIARDISRLLDTRGESRIVQRPQSKRRSKGRALGIQSGIGESRIGGPSMPSSRQASITSPSSSASGQGDPLTGACAPSIEAYDSVSASGTDRYSPEPDRGTSSSRGSQRYGPTQRPRRSTSLDSVQLVNVLPPGPETRNSIRYSEGGRHDAGACPHSSSSGSRDHARPPATSASQISSTGAICSYASSNRSNTEPNTSTRWPRSQPQIHTSPQGRHHRSQSHKP